MRIPILFSIAMLGACQTAPKPAVPATQTWDEFVRDHPDTFVQTYEQNNVAARQQLEQQGLAADLKTIRAFVDAYLPAGDYTTRATGATAAILRRLRVDNITNTLVGYGYQALQFRDAAQAKRLVRAAAGAIGGLSDGADLAVFTPIVVVVQLERVDDAPDGTSTAIYRSAEPLKNAPGKGELIRIALRGPTARSPYPPPPVPGEEDFRRPGRSVLFLSPRRSTGSLREDGDVYSKVSQPMAVAGDQLTGGYHSSISEMTLSALKAAIREQVCAPGFVAVGTAGGTSLPC